MTANKPGDPTTLNRLYGRSKGKKLRVEQVDLVDNLLPQISVPETGELGSMQLFGDDRAMHFEIGFGGGEQVAAGRLRHLADLGNGADQAAGRAGSHQRNAACPAGPGRGARAARQGRRLE